MAHRPMPTHSISALEHESLGTSNLWLEDVPELERLTADEFIDWYLAQCKPDFVEWYLSRQGERDEKDSVFV